MLPGRLANPFWMGMECAWITSASRAVKEKRRIRESSRRREDLPRSMEWSGCDCISKYVMSYDPPCMSIRI